MLIALDDVAVCRPDGELLFKTGKLHIFQGDRIVLLGANGAGKSQLVKLLRRAVTEPESVVGIKVSPSLALGYMDQPCRSCRCIPRRPRSSGSSTSATSAIAACWPALASPSKSRTGRSASFPLASAPAWLCWCCWLSEPNFYLLDEPTNHIDIAGQEALQAEILAHEATCVLVSHDRRFVRDIGTRFLRIGRKRLTELDGPRRVLRRNGRRRLALNATANANRRPLGTGGSCCLIVLEVIQADREPRFGAHSGAQFVDRGEAPRPAPGARRSSHCRPRRPAPARRRGGSSRDAALRSATRRP